MKQRKNNFWNRLPLGQKIFFEVTMMALVLIASNIFIYWQVNRAVSRMDSVYASNVNLSELSETLGEVQQNMYNYVSVQSSDALENYYRSQQNYTCLLYTSVAGVDHTFRNV